MAIQTQLQYIAYDSQAAGAGIEKVYVKIWDDAISGSDSFLTLDFTAEGKHSWELFPKAALSELATQAAAYSGVVKSSLSLPSLVAARDYYGADGVTVTKRVEFYV